MLSKSLFAVTAAALLVQGVRNILWSESKEQERFRSIVRRGLRAHMAINGILIVIFGGVLAYASRTVPSSSSWQILGLAIVLLGCIVLLTARLGSAATPTLKQMPADSTLRKRVLGRRLSGALLLLGGIAWVWNGAGYAMQ